MNTFQSIDISYLRANRTIETILLKNGTTEKVLYTYNFEGTHYRVFENIGDILHFFEDKFDPKVSFDNETDLDNYLNCMDLETIK